MISISKHCTVHRFEYEEHRTGSWLVADDYAVEEAIKEIRGRILPGTAMLVPSGRISPCGYLLPEVPHGKA